MMSHIDSPPQQMRVEPFTEVYDISVTLGEESIDYPGDTPYARAYLSTLDDGAPYELSSLRMSPHSGTHLDFPAHFIPGGKTVEAYSVSEFIRPAQVIDIRHPERIVPDELKFFNIRPREALLFKTDNSRTGRSRDGVFSKQYVYLSAEAAQYCVQRDVGLVGIDYATIEQYENETFAAHRQVLGSNIPVLEGLNLESVPTGPYTLYCLPLKIKGGEAAPVRAILMR